MLHFANIGPTGFDLVQLFVFFFSRIKYELRTKQPCRPTIALQPFQHIQFDPRLS